MQYIPTLATGALDPYYPFPLQGIVVTVPPGTPGSVADVAVSNAEGSTVAHSGFRYLPVIQQFSLGNAVLVQGIYDRHRDVYYFTDQNQVRVFSRTQSRWLVSLPIANSTRLWGIALSPDGRNLAVGDAGADLIYLLNPDSPGNVRTFPLPNTGLDQREEPAGLAVTDSGTIYYSSFYSGGPAFHKLDPSTGTVSDYEWPRVADAYTRVLLSNDNARVYLNGSGIPMMMDTATETTFLNTDLLVEGDDELTLSSNGTWMSASEYLADTNLNPLAFSAYTEREVWNVLAVYGDKLSPDGNLLFSPLQNAIDVLDGKRGNLLTRVSLPFSLSSNYDALVSDGVDNVLVAITGDAGSGIAVIDLSSIPEPSPPSYGAIAHGRPIPMTPKPQFQAATEARAQVGSKSLTSERKGIKHVIKPPNSLPYFGPR
jgi:streptogramin lyase